MARSRQPPKAWIAISGTPAKSASRAEPFRAECDVTLIFMPSFLRALRRFVETVDDDTSFVPLLHAGNRSGVLFLTAVSRHLRSAVAALTPPTSTTLFISSFHVFADVLGRINITEPSALTSLAFNAAISLTLDIVEKAMDSMSNALLSPIVNFTFCAFCNILSRSVNVTASAARCLTGVLILASLRNTATRYSISCHCFSSKCSKRIFLNIFQTLKRYSPDVTFERNSKYSLI